MKKYAFLLLFLLIPHTSSSGGFEASGLSNVALTVPSFLSVSGSPLRGSGGTLALSLSGTALPALNGGTGVTSLGTLSDVGTDGIVVTGGSSSIISNVSFAQHVSDSTHNGYLSSTDWSTFNGKGAGTVTSVTFTGDGTVLSATPSSAVTASGTVTASLATQTAATILAGPTNGSAAAPTFRAMASTDNSTAAVASPNQLINLGLKYSIGSSALTASVVQADGSTNASASSPAVYFTRGTTATTGSYTRNAITAAASVVVSSTTTLGLTSSVNNWLYIYGATGGTVLASTALYDENTLQSFVQESAALTSISNASPGVATLNGHGLNNGDAITLTTSGSLPTGLAISTVYYVVSTAANTFQFAATPGGTAINTSSNGSGTHTYHVASSRLVCTTGTAATASQGIKLLGRMQFNITAGTWAAPAEVSPAVAIPVRNPPTYQKFTSGSGTYITPTGVLYLEVTMVGAGGGGGGSGSAASAGSGSTGGTTTFGSSLLSCTGGGGGSGTSGKASGGSASITGPTTFGLAQTGGSGDDGSIVASQQFGGGRGGAAGTFANGPGGGGGQPSSAGQNGLANTGGGGSGGSMQNTAGYSGGGGGGGGYVHIYLSGAYLYPTYAYSIGSGGGGGTAGTSGGVGGTGGSGVVLVTEYYQ